MSLAVPHKPVIPHSRNQLVPSDRTKTRTQAVFTKFAGGFGVHSLLRLRSSVNV